MPTFEELAGQLAGAPDPRSRIAAAERLAELDDPRVASALARALADPDPAVRQRADELLALFGRRDRGGSLGTLLDEAERVAARLAAEVQRLRGGEAEEPASAPVEPIEPPDGYEGECAVLRLGGGPLDIKRAGRIVAQALERPLFEITREISRTKGFFALGVPAHMARQIVRELAETGVMTAAVPVALLPQALDIVRVRDVRCLPDSLRGRVLPSGQESLAWDTIEVVVAGRLELDLQPAALEEDWSPLTRPLQTPAQGRAEPVFDYVVEVFGGEPLRRLRLITHELDFRVMQRRVSGFSKVAHMARDLVRHVDRRRVAAGVWRLADRDQDAWDDLTFISPLGYEDYATWQRTLLVLGVPLPR